MTDRVERDATEPPSLPRFRFGSPIGNGGCCGYPEGCTINTKACVYKPRKKAWQDADWERRNTRRIAATAGDEDLCHCYLPLHHDGEHQPVRDV